MQKFIEVTTSNNNKKLINLSSIQEISIHEDGNSKSVIILSDNKTKYYVKESYSLIKEMTGVFANCILSHSDYQKVSDLSI